MVPVLSLGLKRHFVFLRAYCAHVITMGKKPALPTPLVQEWLGTYI